MSSEIQRNSKRSHEFAIEEESEKLARTDTAHSDVLSVIYFDAGSYHMPVEIAYCILQGAEIDTLKALRLTSRSFKNLSEAYAIDTALVYGADLSTQTSRTAQAIQAFKYLSRLYQATLKLWQKGNLSAIIPTHSNPGTTRSPQLIRLLLNEVREQITDRKNQESGSWLGQLCLDFPDEAVSLHPFLKDCLTQRAASYELPSDFEKQFLKRLNDQTLPPLDASLILLICVYLSPKIVLSANCKSILMGLESSLTGKMNLNEAEAKIALHLVTTCKNAKILAPLLAWLKSHILNHASEA